MENKINLKEILQKQSKITYEEEGVSRYFTAFEQSIINKSMLEFGKQLLELAAENIGFVKTTPYELNCDEYKPFIMADDNTVWTINKQSILDVIKQIK